MRFVFTLLALSLTASGVLLLVVSLKVDNLKVNYGNFSAALLGIGLLIASVLIVLLVEILTELQKINKPH